MNILVLAPQPFFQDRGTPIATLKLLNLLATEGHRLDLLTYHEGEAIEVANCTHHRIPGLPLVNNVPPGFSLKKVLCDVVMLFSVIRICLRRRFDLVHAVEESVFMAMLIKLVTGTPYIYDMDSSLPRQLLDQMPVLKFCAPLLRFCEGQAVRHSLGVVAVCQSLEEVAASHTDRVPIVRVEDASLITAGGRHAGTMRKASTLALPQPVFMYVGNLQSYQGIHLLLDSFAHVFHRDSDAQLVIVGGCLEDVKRYESRAAEIGIAKRTHFLGARPIDELADYLEQADVLVSPRTLGTNTPMKVFSYLESGKPVLATRLPMHTQVLDEDISYLVDPDPLAMSRGMIELLENERLRDAIAGRAQERIRSEFNSEMLDTKLSVFFQELEQSLVHNDHQKVG